MLINIKRDSATIYNVDSDNALGLGFSADEIANGLSVARSAEAKAECRRRIYAVASAEAQMNISASVAVISGKAASARSEDEKATLAGATSMTEWIAAMRATCADLSQAGEADFRADAAWPEVPEDVVTLVARF
ncbi:hypothetical protein DL1_03335 [Thioclava dalianensis]|uniref:Uncharacterized protein n=1 Tax=Thioclava dalianensis TaxID=1185766 RepID=A0A074TKZ1_9RHOB|nr:hypothetical protein [Thioclava dalianensis]KEP69658.1 hypothetical protein DL1_03335 [Thioclava dalianensis]SFN16295.1 hypothetical protein SAMN05216224_102729 [Thioclava dalianensis]